MKGTDELDDAILNILEEDARTSYREIKAQLGISIGTIHNRMNKLKKNKIIEKFSIEINTIRKFAPKEAISYIFNLLEDLQKKYYLFSYAGFRTELFKIQKEILTYLGKEYLDKKREAQEIDES